MACIPAIINQHPVCLEFVQSQVQQSQGLAGRTTIPENYGLVFSQRGEAATRPLYFKMSKMKLAIDMVFIRHNQIILIEYNVPPCRVTAAHCPIYGGFAADYVLETKAGNANQWGLALYQQLAIKVNNPKNKPKPKP